MLVTSWRKVWEWRRKEGRKQEGEGGVTGAGKERQTGHSTEEACRGRQEGNRGMRKGHLDSAVLEITPVVLQRELEQFLAHL